MANAKLRSALGKNATRNGRGANSSSPLVGTAINSALRKERVSIRGAARLMRVSKSTVERYLAKGFPIPPLRSRRLALPFAECLLELVQKRNGRTT